MSVLTLEARDAAVAPLLAMLAEADRKEMGRLLRPIELSYARQLRRAFARQRVTFLARWKVRKLREAPGDEEWDWNWEPYFTAAAGVTDTLFRHSTETAVYRSWDAAVRANRRRLRLVATFNLPNPLAEQYAREAAALLVRNVTDTTRQQIRAIIVDAISKGDSYSTTAGRIRALFDGFAKPSPLLHIRDRAELIAVTETGNAYSEATMRVAHALEATGMDMEKSWLTVGDDRVDQPHCRANESQGWIPLDEPFASGHDRPLAHPGCRCAVLTRREGSNG